MHSCSGHGERPEVADVFSRFAHEMTGLDAHKRKVVHDIINCRTPALGGHIHQCDHCGYFKSLYNSCMNRHCPKCQTLKQARWSEDRRKDLLPVEYFHMVFTIPSVLHPLFRSFPRTCCNLLFSAVSQTLQEVAASPSNLGARTGFVAVLHTWTQTLLYHPHIHCVVPGGGLENNRWISCRPGFFLPVRILSSVFRGKLLAKLQQAVSRGEIRIPEDPCALLRKAALKPWVVYSKPPFSGPAQVLRYLGRYTHRIAISNGRMVSLQGRTVTFGYRDRNDEGRYKLISMDACEFIRRFLMHVLPRGFMRIRHFGFLSNAVRRKSVDLCRRLIAQGDGHEHTPEVQHDHETWQQMLMRVAGTDITLCPVCGTGHLVRKEIIPPQKWTVTGKAASP